MRHTYRHLMVALVAAATLLAFAPALAAAPSPDDEKIVMQRVLEVLQRYGRNDQAGVLAMMDTPFAILGSNFSIVVRTPDEYRALMKSDFEQSGNAEFSQLSSIDFRSDGTFAICHYFVTYTANGASILFRFSMTWHKVNGIWLLAQSATSMPPSQ